VTLVAQQAALLLYPQIMVATPVPVASRRTGWIARDAHAQEGDVSCSGLRDLREPAGARVKNILVLNGHGGNVAPLRESVPEFARKLGIRIQTNSYWDAYTPEIIKKYMASGKAPGHAGEFETSFAMAAFPERVHWEGVGLRQNQAAFAHQGSELGSAGRGVRQGGETGEHGQGEAMIDIAVSGRRNA